MTDDTITFDPLGTITVTFDGTSYRLTRPKMGQWRYFQRKLSEMADASRAALTDLTERAEAAEAEGDADKAKLLEEELREFARRPFYESTMEWVREVFTQLSDRPLPDDVDEWPVWLAADSALPAQIINHWKTIPKASGENNAT